MLEKEVVPHGLKGRLRNAEFQCRILISELTALMNLKHRHEQRKMSDPNHRCFDCEDQ